MDKDVNTEEKNLLEKNKNDSDSTTKENVDDENKETDVDYREKLNIQNRFLKKEGYEFVDGKWSKSKKSTEKVSTTSKNEDSLSTDDIYTLIEAKIPREDIEIVKKFSKIEEISISESLQNDELRVLLKARADKRALAQATNTGTAKKGQTVPSDDEVIRQAETGTLPEDPALLAKARWNSKKTSK